MKNFNLKSVSIYLLASFLGAFIAIASNYFFFSKQQSHTNDINSIDYKAKVVNFPTTSDNVAIDFTLASDKTLNSVVHITTESEQELSEKERLFYEFFNGGKIEPQVERGFGSGVILSEDGYIVTNNHVINNAQKIKVILNDNREFEGKLIGTDPSTDIAVIKIEGNNFQKIEIGNSDEVKIGQWVLAVGNPFNLTSTVTAGIISAKSRNINIMERNNSSMPIESFIQTDAAVNPGNSGGALVNVNGELIGINTAIASITGSYSGYSFAVPVNLMKKVSTDIIKYGIVKRAVLGVSIQDLNQEVINNYKLNVSEGVYINGVYENSSADNMGIKEGDVIIEVENKAIKSSPKLQEIIGSFNPGDKINIVVIRDNKTIKLSGILKSLDQNMVENNNLASSNDENKNFGATFIIPSKELKNKLKITEGVQVKDIKSGVLSNLGIEKDFIITHIDNISIKSVSNLNNLLLNNKNKKNHTIKGIYPNGTKAVYSGFIG